jgi:pimeloyl-ACP methyl ester carboxylesterase
VAAFCLIHGAWHDSSYWEPVAARLRDEGHEAIAPELPLHDPRAGFAERLRPALAAIDDVEGPLVLVGHSQGSAYSTLVAARRPVSLLVHLCPRLGGLTPPPGAPEMFRGDLAFPEDRPDGTSKWETDAATSTLYGGLEPEVARGLAERLRPMAPAADEYPLTEHPDVPTVLIYAAGDRFFRPDWERFMARELLGIEPIEIRGGHFPMIEDPSGLASLLARVWDDNPPCT